VRIRDLLRDFRKLPNNQAEDFELTPLNLRLPEPLCLDFFDVEREEPFVVIVEVAFKER
jgi:hypothetical protein